MSSNSQPNPTTTMSLKDIAENIGTITDEQTNEPDDKLLEDDDMPPRRNLNEYDGAYDPEGRSDREQ